jgi:tRNA-specific 2-thiouridylase
MREHSFDRIATGHYARIEERDGRYSVLRASDGKKDQSYVLYRLPQEILAHLLTPLATYAKEDVRVAARESGLAAAERAESMEICFLPDGDYPAYIRERFGAVGEGDFIGTDGRVLGRHRGILHYTVGQRKGLGIALGERMFVSHIDPECNTVTLSRDAERGSQDFSVGDVVFSGLSPQKTGEMVCTVKLRYLAPPIPVTVCFDGDTLRAKTKTPIAAITPGQSAVFYDGDRVLFGGFIL